MAESPAYPLESVWALRPGALLRFDFRVDYGRFWQEVLIARLLQALRELDDDDLLWDFWHDG